MILFVPDGEFPREGKKISAIMAWHIRVPVQAESLQVVAHSSSTGRPSYLTSKPGDGKEWGKVQSKSTFIVEQKRAGGREM